MIDDRIIKLLIEIDFVHDYEKLLTKFQGKNELKYKHTEVLELLKEINKAFEYDKKEDFYCLKIQDGVRLVQLNIVLYSRVEFILFIEDNEQSLKDGGPFTRLIKVITNGEKRLTDVPFETMADLKAIVEWAVEILEKIRTRIIVNF